MQTSIGTWVWGGHAHRFVLACARQPRRQLLFIDDNATGALSPRPLREHNRQMNESQPATSFELARSLSGSVPEGPRSPSRVLLVPSQTRLIFLPSTDARSARWAARARPAHLCRNPAPRAVSVLRPGKSLANAVARVSKDTTASRAAPATHRMSAVSARRFDVCDF